MKGAEQPSGRANAGADTSSTSREVEELSLKDAFDIYQKMTENGHKLWAYFQFLSIAVLGYTLGTDKAEWSIRTYVLVGSAFLLFSALSNRAIFLAQREANRMAVAINDATSSESTGAEKLEHALQIETTPPIPVSVFHAVVSVLVLAGIFSAYIDKCSTGDRQCPRKSRTAEASDWPRSLTTMQPVTIVSRRNSRDFDH